jgi:hypothetical protein
MQEMILDNAFKTGFIESGGKLGTADDGAETPYQVIKHYLKNGR